jgi:hypothetical protein
VKGGRSGGDKGSLQIVHVIYLNLEGAVIKHTRVWLS